MHGVRTPLQHGEGFPVAPWHDSMTVADTNLELTKRDHLGVGIVGALQASRMRSHPALLQKRGVTYLVKVALHYSYISSQGFEVIVNLLGAQITSAQDVLDLARDLSEPQRLDRIFAGDRSGRTSILRNLAGRSWAR